MMVHIKRLLSFVTVASLLISSIPLLVNASESGVTPDGFVWEQGGARTCYIIGYSGTEKNIVIPQTIDKFTVSAVQVDAFRGTDIESVEMPQTVNYICQRAFKDCKSLRSVIISPTTEDLQTDAFNGCTSLTDVTIPIGVKNINKQVFMGCTALEHIKLPEGLKTIDNNAFNGCTSLKSIELPTTLQTIGNTVFLNCSSFCTTTIYIYGEYGVQAVTRAVYFPAAVFCKITHS